MQSLLEPEYDYVYRLQTRGSGTAGELPLTDALLRHRPSGDLFGMVQDVGMGWNPSEVDRPQFVILSTLGGLRAEAGRPIALGYHSGHWELREAVAAVAESISAHGGLPYAAYVSDPCDGRTQGTAGMFDSLAYRNDAAVVFGRLLRSIPQACGVVGVASCDKGLPAVMMALARHKHLPGLIVPGGVMLPSDSGEDTGRIQAIGTRYVHGELSLEEAARLGCRVCASGGGGCHFLGTAATGQVIAEALGLTLPHAALAPSGQDLWLDLARRSGAALMELFRRRIPLAEILTEKAVENAMVCFAAFGGSTNFLLHLPAVAFAAQLPRPSLEDWERINRRVPRIVSVLPNGPVNFPTLFVFLAGGVPEVMLQLRKLGLLHEDVLTVSGLRLGQVLDWWQRSPHRQRVRRILQEQENIDPDQVILTPEGAQRLGITSTICFPRGNLAPGGSVIKSTAIRRELLGSDGVYRKTGPARVFTREKEAIAAIKGEGPRAVRPGDVLVLIARGPLGAGMEEIFQVTSGLTYLSWGHEVAVLTDARFSGVSTGPCIGWITPEALAGGPIAKLRDGDKVRIVIDTRLLTGSVDFVGTEEREFDPAEGARILAERPSNPAVSPDPQLPPETHFWAILQQLSGGPWRGAVYDYELLIELLERLLPKEDRKT